MIRSMTGFGQKHAPWQDGAVTVEVRSVNHRFLEIACRLPRPLHALEEPFKKAVQQRCTRGRIDMTVSAKDVTVRTATAAGRVLVNADVIRLLRSSCARR